MSDTHTHKGRTQRQSGCFLWCGGGERKTERERERERETERLTHHSVLCLVDSERDRQRTERERERLTQHSVLGQGAVVDHVLCLVGTQEVEVIRVNLITAHDELVHMLPRVNLLENGFKGLVAAVVEPVAAAAE